MIPNLHVKSQIVSAEIQVIVHKYVKFNIIHSMPDICYEMRPTCEQDLYFEIIEYCWLVDLFIPWIYNSPTQYCLFTFFSR